MKWNSKIVNSRRLGMYHEYELSKYPDQISIAKSEGHGDIQIAFGINPITGNEFKSVDEAKKFVEKVFRVFNRI